MPTSLMGLTTSTPGVTNDLTAATSEQSNYQVIDIHDHSSMKGAQVPTAGLNINANLGFAGFKAFNFLAAQFSNQTSSLSAAENKPCVYSLNGELRFIDNSGNDVLITNAGSVNSATGSISGLSSPVAAGFSSSTFTWQANAGTGIYAKMANADVSLYESLAGVTNAVTLKSPATLAASYSVTLPAAAPASTQYVTMATTGQLATASADSVGSAMTATGSNAIGSTMTATGSNAIGSVMTATGGNAIANVRTRTVSATAAAGGVASSSAASFSTSSVSFVNVVELSVTITSTGRPIQIMLISGGPSQGFISLSRTGTSSNGFIRLLRGAVAIADSEYALSGASGFLLMRAPPPGVFMLDAVAAGTYVYQLQAGVSEITMTLGISNVRMVAYEI